MKADRRTLEQVFVPTVQLVAPIYQRPYVWKEETNWVPLWESIKDVAEDKLAGRQGSSSFLGAIVVGQPDGAMAWHKKQIIDGQQRLTTLQILFAVLRDICQAANLSSFMQAFAMFTENNIPCCDNEEDRFKVWPTNMNGDQEHFRRTMKAGSKERLLADYKASKEDTELSHRIPSAYLFFHRIVSEWLGDSTASEFQPRMKVLDDALRRDVPLVAIDLEEKDDPQVIFESLNALGTPLLPADLVKNYLLHRAKHGQEDPAKLYKKYWEHFADNEAFWRKETRQGRLNRPRIDIFLQHYLTMMTGQEVGSSHLFTAFRRFTENGEFQKVEEHFRLLHDYGQIFESWANFTEESPEGLFFYRLEQLDTTTVYPLLLEVFSTLAGKDKRPELLGILRDLESYLVRRTVIGLTPKDYNHLFLDLLNILKIKGFTAANACQFLHEQDKDTRRWPTDEEFDEAWKSRQVYHTVVRKRLRMILEAIELSAHSDWSEAKIKIGQNLTIEHLMPVGWRDHWPLEAGEPDEEAAREERDGIIHTIGNLTILTTKLNSSLSNGPWKNKLAAILEHAVLKINLELKDRTKWNEDAIRERTDLLLSRAKKIWSRPPGGPRFVPQQQKVVHLGPKQRKQLRLEFWTAFVSQFKAFDNPLLKTPSPSKGSWLWYPIGRANYWLWTHADVEKRLVSIGLTCTGPLGKSTFEALEAQKTIIEKDVGTALVWEDVAGQKAKFIVAKRQADLSDRALWPEVHQWMITMLSAFQITFAGRIKQIKPAAGTTTDDRKIASAVEGHMRQKSEFELLARRSRSVWFVPKPWLSFLPRNGTAWKHLPNPISVCCWLRARRGKAYLVFELSQMKDAKLRLACATSLREAGFKIDDKAFRLDAKYSRFYRRALAIPDVSDPSSIALVVDQLLTESKPQLEKAGSVLQSVFESLEDLQ